MPGDVVDATARLGQGRPAVEVLAQYVWACRQLGYQDADLTLHAGQLYDWYGTEDGMDLAALHHDCTELDMAARMLEGALAVQDRQRGALSTVWQGAGADAAEAFLRRHSDASAATVTAVRTARDAVAVLCESLREIVDGKVEATLAVENRAAAERGRWLAAAATVSTGVGDRSVASEVVGREVLPFVDSSVRTEWLTAMRSAVDSVREAYQRAATEIAGEPLPAFEIAGDLGPVPSPPPGRPRVAELCCDAPAVATAAPVPEPGVAPTAPAAWTMPDPAAPGAPPVVPESPVPAAPSPGSAGPALPDIGGGLPGLGQQFSDALSGLLGGAGEVVPELLPELDVPELDDPDETSDQDPEAEADQDGDIEEASGEEVAEEAEDEAEEETAEEAGEETAGDEGEAPSEGPAVAAPVDVVPPPAEPLPPMGPPAEPVAAGRTPCEIAADELPQVGESSVSSPGQPAGG